MVCKLENQAHFLICIPVALGFLGGKEVKAKGLTNIGLRDRKCFGLLDRCPI
jgi:hypothetical protein